MMNNNTVKGYVQYALDTMYIYMEKPLSDEQRDLFFNHLEMAFDYLTEEEALLYYRTHSNTNIQEV